MSEDAMMESIKSVANECSDDGSSSSSCGGNCDVSEQMSDDEQDDSPDSCLAGKVRVLNNLELMSHRPDSGLI